MKDVAEIKRWHVLKLQESTKSISTGLIINQLNEQNETDFNCDG